MSNSPPIQSKYGWKAVKFAPFFQHTVLGQTSVSGLLYISPSTAHIVKYPEGEAIGAYGVMDVRRNKTLNILATNFYDGEIQLSKGMNIAKATKALACIIHQIINDTVEDTHDTVNDINEVPV